MSEAVEIKTGYPVEIFVTKVDERFTCPLCLDVLNEPVQCTSGHLFCKYCISKAIEMKKKCPTCRCHLTESNLSKSLIVRDMIAVLPVLCTSTLVKAKGSHVCCQWSGQLSQLSLHVASECQFQNVKCDFEGCQKILPVQLLDDHKRVCEFSKMTCFYCKQKIFSYCLSYHTARCDENKSALQFLAPETSTELNPHLETYQLPAYFLSLENNSSSTRGDRPVEDNADSSSARRRVRVRRNSSGPPTSPAFVTNSANMIDNSFDIHNVSPIDIMALRVTRNIRSVPFSPSPHVQFPRPDGVEILSEQTQNSVESVTGRSHTVEDEDQRDADQRTNRAAIDFGRGLTEVDTVDGGDVSRTAVTEVPETSSSSPAATPCHRFSEPFSPSSDFNFTFSVGTCDSHNRYHSSNGINNSGGKLSGKRRGRGALKIRRRSI